MSGDLPVAVVISSFEEGAALAATVASLLAAPARPAEVLIVDDGSTDGSTAGPWPPSVRVLQRAHAGIAPARNAGALAAAQPLLVFLDAHCTVDPGWLAPLVAALERHPDAIAGPAVHDEREPARAGCGAHLVDPLFTYRWNRPAGDALQAVGLVPGGCLAVAREPFLATGGFGPFREFGLEDVDLSLCWWRMGRPLLGVPRSHVTHRFRVQPPYRPDLQAWVENVLTTALRHLSGAHLAETVRCCARLGTFNAAIAAALARLPEGDRQAVAGGRACEEYLREWAEQAWPVVQDQSVG
ncbi:glycosyltransferase family 2 protein [Pseudoduganella chitinolytica]|uniref:Glycosyltransferase n=1 Tax=Pseudoduganella chitinolytica TaxID=34070 RepID=A0ABY8BKN9_9BURK|nr:glycosyltransferase [Pseudoduganella chitinolytica]WEF35242.1 glycosyltransferase [Pseudoduganella chitinolytica]